jgi:hypothetical protein
MEKDDLRIEIQRLAAEADADPASTVDLKALAIQL